MLGRGEFGCGSTLIIYSLELKEVQVALETKQKPPYSVPIIMTNHLLNISFLSTSVTYMFYSIGNR